MQSETAGCFPLPFARSCAGADGTDAFALGLVLAAVIVLDFGVAIDRSGLLGLRGGVSWLSRSLCSSWTWEQEPSRASIPSSGS